MIEKLMEWDRALLLFFNSLHADWLDPVMLWMTETFFWLPLYAFLLYLIFKTYKKDGWIVLFGIALTILLTDRITSGLMKPYFQRLRPSQEPTLVGLVHLVKQYKGGMYGFASSHAANTVGTAMYFFLVFRKQYRWIVWLFPWAVVMTYTRIYLGVHYPGDILVGGMVGLLSGWTAFHIQKKISAWNAKRKTPASARPQS